MPSFNITTPNEALKDISSILIELGHNQFMLELESRQPGIPLGKEHEHGYLDKCIRCDVAKCVECGVKRDKREFQRIFQSGDKGICRKCFYHDEDLDLDI